jgi:hypothetical protein
MPLSDAGVRAVRGCVAAALRHESGSQHEWAWDGSVPEDEFITAVTRHRVVEVIAENLDGLTLPDRLVNELRAERDRRRLAALVQAHELFRAMNVLDTARIPCLPFKGQALAVQSTGDFTARGLGDLDLFVHPARVADAHAALSAAGWEPWAGSPAPGPSWAWRHLLDTSHSLPLRGERSSIDLHWWLEWKHAALPDFDTAWTRRVTVAVAGFDLPTLALPDAFAHSCSNAAKDDWRWLRSLVDVYRLARMPSLWESLSESRLRPADLLTLAAVQSCFDLPPKCPRQWCSRPAPPGPAWLGGLGRHSGSPSRAREPPVSPALSSSTALAGFCAGAGPSATRPGSSMACSCQGECWVTSPIAARRPPCPRPCSGALSGPR